MCNQYVKIITKLHRFEFCEKNENNVCGIDPFVESDN